MEFSDRILICGDCQEEFVFSAGEQLFFAEKRFQHEPKRCVRCRAKRANAYGRRETRVTCSECGASTTVPFNPHLGRPVLCRSCFNSKKQVRPTNPI